VDLEKVHDSEGNQCPADSKKQEELVYLQCFSQVTAKSTDSKGGPETQGLSPIRKPQQREREVPGYNPFLGLLAWSREAPNLNMDQQSVSEHSL
jgi:hypothetical protein